MAACPAPSAAGIGLQQARHLPIAPRPDRAGTAAALRFRPWMRVALALLAPALILGGCAMPGGPAAHPPASRAPRGAAERPAEPVVAWRLTLQTRRSGWPPRELTRYVQTATGLAVRHLSASAPQWQIIELRCPGEPACRQAVQRLRQDDAFGVIEVDRRVQPAARPAP